MIYRQNPAGSRPEAHRPPMKILPVIALSLLVVGAGSAAAGTLAPGLEHQLQSTAADQPVKVLVVLAKQADLPALDRELRAEKAATSDRHRRVLAALHAATAGSQEALLASLGADKAAGRVLGWTPHWLINGVVVTATPDAIRAIAARPDVDRVEADLVPELIEPIPGTKDPVTDKAVPVGITPGVRAVNAPRVWRELGIDGTGVVVGILDTGVDGTHPALASRWRGNYAPASECWFDGAGLGDAVPIDRHYHGTHVMGTLTGLAPGDTIGVAPGALWIASNVINSNTGGDAFDNGILASLEFMADPDGNPDTSDDVPAVVHNSWGVSEQLRRLPRLRQPLVGRHGRRGGRRRGADLVRGQRGARRRQPALAGRPGHHRAERVLRGFGGVVLPLRRQQLLQPRPLGLRRRLRHQARGRWRRARTC